MTLNKGYLKDIIESASKPGSIDHIKLRVALILDAHDDVIREIKEGLEEMFFTHTKDGDLILLISIGDSRKVRQWQEFWQKYLNLV